MRFYFFELIETVMGINSLAGHFFFEITDVVLVFFEPSSPLNSQRIDSNQATNNTTKTLHTNTRSHNQTQHNINTNTNKHRHITHFQHRAAHFIPSGTRLEQFFDTNKFGQTVNEPKYRKSDSLASRSRVCTERERARLDE